MVNKAFRSIADLRDVESLNLYNIWREAMGEEAAFRRVLAGSRDHARTPMQWRNAAYAGFSEAAPWIGTDDDCKTCNVEDQRQAGDSVLNFYRQLIRLRKSHPALVYGETEFVQKKTRGLLAYHRRDGGAVFYVECNLSREKRKRRGKPPEGLRLLSNYPESKRRELRPYEATIWQLRS
jgi:oligo-1,6-glucosidase